MSVWKKNLRFLVALVAAILASLITQVIVGLASELIPASDTIQDHASQLANSLLGSWVYIRVGAALAPAPHKTGAAYLFAALSILLSVLALVATLIGYRTGYTFGWLLVCTIGSVIALVFASNQVLMNDPELERAAA